MTLEEFRKAAQPGFDAHAEVARLEWELARSLKVAGEDVEELGRH